MPVATLTLRSTNNIWAPTFRSIKLEWLVEISGLNQFEKEVIKKRFPLPYDVDECGLGETHLKIARNDGVWEVGDHEDMPMTAIVGFLNVLEEMKFKVVATHSLINANSRGHVIVWTLRKDQANV